MITFTSSSTVENFLALGLPWPQGMQVASIGPITSKTARERGLTIATEATRHDIPGLVEAIRNFLRHRRSMSTATGMDPDFAAVMQDLSAQASPQENGGSHADLANGITASLSALHALGQRIEALEETMIRKFEPLSLAKIEKDVTAIRESESVNQRLFDSLHGELASYRDNLIRESLQKPFIRDLLVLFDDLSAIAGEAEETACNPDARPQETQATG